MIRSWLDKIRNRKGEATGEGEPQAPDAAGTDGAPGPGGGGKAKRSGRRPVDRRPAAAPESAARAANGANGADAERPRRRRRRRGKRGPGKGDAPADGAGGSTGSEREGRTARATPARRAQDRPAWDPASFEVPEKEGVKRFHDFGLSPEIFRAVAELDFQYCTPIQAETLPILLAGRDVAGRAQTGTGKTAAFLIAIFERFLRHPFRGERPAATPRALVIAPTRELAVQIERDAHALGQYADVRTLALFGGADFDGQLRKVRAQNPELIVATPGRLLDFRSRHELHLGRVEVMVIDEADRMLDMGFIPDVRRIVYATPPKTKRQTMLFSATLSDPVLRLASSWMVDPVRVDIEPEQVAVDSVRQVFYLVTAREKFTLLYNLLRREKPERALLFVNRRITAERLTRALKRHGFTCALISGALAQNQRSRTLEAFRAGTLPILVATDVAGRGLHIEGVSHVINYNIPIDAEDYVHRIGRTGRAGATGTSVTFACEEESFYIPPIEAYIGRDLPCEHPPEEWLRMPDDVAWTEIPDEDEPRPRPDRRRRGPRR